MLIFQIMYILLAYGVIAGWVAVFTKADRSEAWLCFLWPLLIALAIVASPLLAMGWIYDAFIREEE